MPKWKGSGPDWVVDIRRCEVLVDDTTGDAKIEGTVKSVECSIVYQPRRKLIIDQGKLLLDKSGPSVSRLAFVARKVKGR